MDWDTGELDRVAADLGKAGVQAGLAARKVVAKAALDVQREAVEAAQRLFRPPPEGDATGATANSIGVDFTAGGLTATVGPTTSYSVYLEFGTRRMSARPFMGPALDVVEPGFTQAIADLGGRSL